MGSGSSTRTRGVEAALICGVAASLALLPALPDFALCPILALTGQPCPTCGTTRSLWSLTHGDFASAWQFNPLGYVLTLVGARHVSLALAPSVRWVAWQADRRVEAGLMALFFAVGTLRALQVL